jgi:hypothetical protein
MNAPFLPLGYIRITDFDGDRTTLRQRLAAGELVAVIWDNMSTGDLVPVPKQYWLIDGYAESMIRDGVFLDGEGRVPLPVLIEWTEPEAQKTNKRGPKDTERARVRAEMRKVDPEDLRRMQQKELAGRFGRDTDSRKMCEQARKEVLAEADAKPAQAANQSAQTGAINRRK